jgi:hypothetical protein
MLREVPIFFDPSWKIPLVLLGIVVKMRDGVAETGSHDFGEM